MTQQTESPQNAGVLRVVRISQKELQRARENAFMVGLCVGLVVAGILFSVMTALIFGGKL